MDTAGMMGIAAAVAAVLEGGFLRGSSVLEPTWCMFYHC